MEARGAPAVLAAKVPWKVSPVKVSVKLIALVVQVPVKA
jgi:hypothetical protein